MNRVENTLYFSAYHLTPANAAQYLREMTAFGPSLLRGYASSIYILARMAEEHSLPVPRVKGIVTGSETLLPKYRECIERVFGIRVCDWYGQAESTVTMSECGAHQGLHLNEDYGVCELVSDPSLAANERRIIATNLDNLAMPLIRYDTGDIAVVSDRRSCSCGRAFPLVSAIRGRSDELIRTRNGRVLPSVNFYAVFHEFDEIRAFQLVQHDLDHVDVRVESIALDAAARARLLAELAVRLGADVRLSLIENEGFEQSADGKKRVIVSKL